MSNQVNLPVSHEQRRQALLQERPPRWEHLLFALYLREGLARIATDWGNAVHGIHPSVQIFPTEGSTSAYFARRIEELMAWRPRFDEITRHHGCALDWKNSSGEFDPDKVAAGAQVLLQHIEQLVHWEQAIAAAYPHPSLQAFHTSLRGKTGLWLEELSKIPGAIEKAARSSGIDQAEIELPLHLDIDPGLVPKPLPAEERWATDLETGLRENNECIEPSKELKLMLYLFPGIGYFHYDKWWRSLFWATGAVILYSAFAPLGMILHGVYIGKMRSFIREKQMLAE